MPRRDPISLLTLAELDSGSRLLKADFVYHLTTPGAPRKWEAVAVACWLLERRTDPTATIARYRSMTSEEVDQVLGSYANTPGAGDAPSAEEVLSAVRGHVANLAEAGQTTVDVSEVLDLLGSAEVDTVEDPVDTVEAPTDTAPAPVDTGAPEVANPTAPPPESSSPGPGESTPPTSHAARSRSTPQ